MHQQSNCTIQKVTTCRLRARCCLPLHTYMPMFLAFQRQFGLAVCQKLKAATSQLQMKCYSIRCGWQMSLAWGQTYCICRFSVESFCLPGQPLMLFNKKTNLFLLLVEFNRFLPMLLPDLHVTAIIPPLFICWSFCRRGHMDIKRDVPLPDSC